METVWERRRLKRETFEPEDMHTVRGGGISAPAWLGPLDLPGKFPSSVPGASLAQIPRHTGHSYVTAIYLTPAVILLLYLCLVLFAAWASFSSINRILSSSY